MDDLEKIIAVDIDGTLCTISDNYEECKLLDNAKESIDYIRSKGYKVF
jgi:hydroxymethylpyrimidine pyrophosphatase-like HAD family hydrolase